MNRCVRSTAQACLVGCGGLPSHIVDFFFFHGAAAHSRPGPPHYRGFTITLRHTTTIRAPVDE